MNAEKIWKQILEKIEKLDWEEDAVFKLLEFSLKNMCSNLAGTDIQRMFRLAFTTWEVSKVKVTDKQNDPNVKLRVVTLMVYISRTRKLNFEQEASNFVLNAINKRKFIPEETQSNKNYINALTELIAVLCHKTKNSKEEPLKIIEVVLCSKNLLVDEKVEVFKAVSKLDIFENELLLPVIVRSLTKKYNKNMDISKEEYDDVRLYVMVESLADFICSREIKINDKGHNQPYVIEFQCDNPNSLYTLPNKLLSILEQHIKEPEKVLDNANGPSRLSVTHMLRCLTAIRPLHENAELEITTILDYHIKHFNSKSDSDVSDKLLIICLAVQVLSDLSCPSDFFKKIDLNVMRILRDNILNTDVARILSSIFYQASLMQTLGNESQKLETIMFGDNPEDKCDEMVLQLRSELIRHLSTTLGSNRKYYLMSLIYLSSRQEKNQYSFKTMLKAENVVPTVATFRDRVKHLGNISWGEEDESELITEITKIRFQGGLRFLLGNLSVNFKLLWDPAIKIIDSYLSSTAYHAAAWEIIYGVFHDANETVIKFKNDNNVAGEKQTKNFRNLILKSLTYSTDFIPIVEKNNQIIVGEFFHIVRPNSETPISPCIKTLETFLELFKKFTNLRNMSKFSEVKEVVIQYILGHSLATDNSLKSAVEFFVSAYKSLRPHKDILFELADGKKWKTRYLALTEETFQHSENSNILAEIIYQLISAKIKRTAKEKRTAQIANRKFIVRTMFQVGLKRGLEFLSFFRKRELLDIDNVLRRNMAIFEKKLALRKLDITFDVFMMAAKNANCGKEIFNEILEILVLQGKMVKKEIIDGKREGAAGKRRNKLLDNLINVFLTLKGCAWSEVQEIQVLTECVWPLLFSNGDFFNKNENISDIAKDVEDASKDKKFHYLSKLPTLFQLWVDNHIYHRWFLLEGDTRKCLQNTEKKNVLQDWMCDQILVSKFADPEFQSKIFTVICNLIVASSDLDKDHNATNVVSQCIVVISRILAQFQIWLTSKTCLKRTKETAPRLCALHVIMKSMKEKTEVNAVFFVEKLSLLAIKGTLQVQTQSLHVLDEALSKLKIVETQVSAQIPLCAFKLLANIRNYDNKKLMAQILWKHVQNFDNEGHSKAISMDDNFLHGKYQKLIKVDDIRQSNCLPEQQFLFLFHFAASEIHNEDFSQRAAAVLCLRNIIRNKKKQMLSNNEGETINSKKEHFVRLVDKVMLPIISKGLESTNDRIQGEFMEVLLECIVTEHQTCTSFLGSIQDVSQLIPSAEDDQESNFFENMKHIQKHRRGREMRKIALKLNENKDFLSRNCRLFLVYPLVRTYIYNKDYISQPEIVNSAITCIASLASTYNWKDYKNLLLQFLVAKNQPKLLDSAPFRKQRVKILSGILNSFHFPPEDDSTLKLKEVITNLLKKVTRMGAAGGSQDVEDQVDIALFVPILKIMIVFPDDWIKSNLSMLIVNLASKLRSRKIEERTAARDVLCEIAKLLGRNYFHFIFSILEGNLQRGYQLHILLFTVNAIMNSMTEGCLIPSAKESNENCTNEMIGAFNESLDKIMHLIGNELFGNILEEKRVAALVKKTPEASKTVSFGLLEKLGSYASKGNIGPILSTLLASNTTHKYIRSSSSTSSYESLQKLRKALRSFQMGIVKNTSFEKTDFLFISLGLLSGKLLVTPENTPNIKSNKALLQEMAFNLLCHNAAQPHAKEMGDSKFDQQVKEMKPFKAFIIECINGKDVNVVTGCLKYLSLITQSRSIVDTLLDENTEDTNEDFMCMITKKCRQYQPMKNNQPYNYICQILRNLLTHNSHYQFATPDQLKSICLFFQMCLETNYDDVNAIKLLGLLLFKFYTEEASSAFLKLLCVCTIKCKDEMTFNMTKPIILKIVKRHKTLTAAMSFYSQHVSYELVDGKQLSYDIITRGSY